MKIASVALFSLMSVSISSFAGETVHQILNSYYPNYDYGEQCRTHEEYNNNLQDWQKFCLKYTTQKTVDTNKGKRQYVLIYGNDFELGMSGGVDEMAGLFILKPDEYQGGWVVEHATPFINTSYNHSEPNKWSFHQFSPDTYGFLSTSGWGGGGVAQQWFTIITPSKNNKTNINNIKSMLKYDEENCNRSKNCSSISAQIKINRSTTVNGFYPLDLTLNGKLNGKRYKNETYRINYQQGKGYVEPSNYPLKDD